MSSLLGRRARLAAVAALFASAITIPAQPAQAAPGDFTVSSTNLEFGDVFVGETAQKKVVITNVSGVPKTPSIAGGGLTLNPEFDAVQNCSAELPAGGTCAFTYTFTPQDLGASNATTLLFLEGQSHTVSLSGNGVVPFTISSTSLDFGNVVIGATVERKVVLTNVSGTAQQPQVAGGGITPGNPEFDGVQNCTQVAPGATCAFTYRFTPADLGVSTTATAIILYDQNHPVTLTGNGVNRKPVTLTTTATAEVALGAPITEKATLEGGVDPTGTITFKVYGPDDATCAGPIVFTSTVGISGAGVYESGPFTPTAAGTYRWVAEYGGDVNNHAVSGACNDSGETSVVTAPAGGGGNGGGGGLPVTGAGALKLAGLGIGAIVLGGLVLYTTRRRRMAAV